MQPSTGKYCDTCGYRNDLCVCLDEKPAAEELRRTYEGMIPEDCPMHYCCLIKGHRGPCEPAFHG